MASRHGAHCVGAELAPKSLVLTSMSLDPKITKKGGKGAERRPRLEAERTAEGKS